MACASRDGSQAVFETAARATREVEDRKAPAIGIASMAETGLRVEWESGQPLSE